MKVYVKMQLHYRECNYSRIDEVAKQLENNEFVKLIDGRIHFISKHSDGTIAEIPFICEAKRIPNSPIEIARQIVTDNTEYILKYRLTDILTRKKYVRHTGFTTDSDEKRLIHGNSNLGEYLLWYDILEATQLKDIVESWTLEDVVAYNKGIQELERIIRETHYKIASIEYSSHKTRVRNERFITTHTRYIAKSKTN